MMAGGAGEGRGVTCRPGREGGGGRESFLTPGRAAAGAARPAGAAIPPPPPSSGSAAPASPPMPGVERGPQRGCGATPDRPSAFQARGRPRPPSPRRGRCGSPRFPLARALRRPPLLAASSFLHPQTPVSGTGAPHRPGRESCGRPRGAEGR